MVAIATYVEPLTECVVLSLLASWSIYHLFSFPPWLVLLLHYPGWIYVDLDVHESLAAHALLPEKRWRFMAAWMLREIIAFPVWLYAIFGNDVDWRGRKYRIIRNGEARKADSQLPWWSSLWFQRRKQNYEQLHQDVDLYE